MVKWFCGFGLLVTSVGPAFAQQTAAPIVGVTVADSGDTAWMMMSALLVFMMALPGATLFVAGQSPAKHTASVITNALAVVAAVSLLWIGIGYSLALSEATPLLGGMDNAFLANLAELRTDTTVPESSYALFQMMLAMLAALLLLGGAIGRVRFGWMLSLSVLWSLCVYVPVAHWMWGNGWLADFGAHDFAGGVVVDVAAGVSALVIGQMAKPDGSAAGARDIVAGPLPMAIGGGLLWVGWLASIGGASLSASDDASAAMINAHMSACAAALVWALVARLRDGSVSTADLLRGAVAGLAASSASAGYIGPIGATVLGAIAGIASALVNRLMTSHGAALGSTNVFAVFGVSGIIGALLFPVFVPTLGGPGFEQGVTMASQLLAQGIAVGAVALWAALITLVMGLGITLVIPMRAAEAEEEQALRNNDVTIGI